MERRVTIDSEVDGKESSAVIKTQTYKYAKKLGRNRRKDDESQKQRESHCFLLRRVLMWHSKLCDQPHKRNQADRHGGRKKQLVRVGEVAEAFSANERDFRNICQRR